MFKGTFPICKLIAGVVSSCRTAARSCLTLPAERPISLSVSYSVRNAVIGFTCMARRAGRKQARSAATASNKLELISANRASDRLLCGIVLRHLRSAPIARGLPVERIETRSLPALARCFPRSFTLITRTAPCLRQLPWLRCRLSARLKLVCFPAHSPLPTAALPSMSLSPNAPFPHSIRVLCR
jgi:hypothetical protein